MDHTLPVVLCSVAGGHIDSCNCDIFGVFFACLVGSEADLDSITFRGAIWARTPANRANSFSIDQFATFFIFPAALWVAEARVIFLACGADGWRDTDSTVVRTWDAGRADVSHATWASVLFSAAPNAIFIVVTIFAVLVVDPANFLAASGAPWGACRTKVIKWLTAGAQDVSPWTGAVVQILIACRPDGGVA